MKKVLIIGGGLVGSLEAIFMAKRGYEVEVYERRPDIRRADLSSGRSINLVISHRGWTALEKAGIKEDIEPITVPVYGRMTHDQEGNTEFQPYSIHQKAIYSVSRGELNAKLLSCAEAFDNVTMHFDKKCTDLDLDNAKATFEDAETGETIHAQGDLVIGTDGANSAVRKNMEKIEGFKSEMNFIEHGYKELIIPPSEDGNPRIDPNALHIWPRKSFMLMALANLDGGFTCTLFFPFKGDPSFESIKTEDDVMKFWEEVFPDAIPLMPTLKKDYFENPTSSLGIVKCDPWVYKDKALLAGDSAHAIVPFYGEGMNCGFEDCYTLDVILDEMGDADMTSVMTEYHNRRKPNGDAISDLSLRNFIEMRDLVADENFLLRKKIENYVQSQHPDRWIPLYSQVKFSDIPYSRAKEEGEKHDRIMQRIMERDGIEDNWENEEVVEMILNQV